MSRDGEAVAPIEVEEAIARLRSAVPESRQTVPMRITDDDLLGRILAEPIHADRDHPPFDRATMDGYAVRTSDLATGEPLPVIGSIPAGAPVPKDVAAGGCIAIATGAAVPETLDAVVEHEATDRGDPLAVTTTDVRAGRNIHRRGADAKAGDVLVPRGTRIDAVARAAAIAGGAAVGTGMVSIRRPPRVAIVTTGDELRPAEDPLDGEDDAVRIRDSNRPLLVDLIADRWTFGGSVTLIRHVTDASSATAEGLDAAAADADLVITVGGVSAGTLDLVPGHWAERGWKKIVRGVRMQPGKTVLGLARPGRRNPRGRPSRESRLRLRVPARAPPSLVRCVPRRRRADRLAIGAAAHRHAGEPPATRLPTRESADRRGRRPRRRDSGLAGVGRPPPPREHHRLRSTSRGRRRGPGGHARPVPSASRRFPASNRSEPIVTSSPDEIRIDLVLHALLREVAGEDLITLRLSAGATAATALATVVDRHPGLAIHAKTVAFARADMIIRPDAILRDGDRVDALPPVSGG